MTPAAPPKGFVLEITLQGIEPRIWRTILIREDIPLVDFHRIIQTCFGWSNSHLHLFKDGVYQYAPREFKVAHTLDSREIRLNEILNKVGQFIYYEYDFGDQWLIKIKLESIQSEGISYKQPLIFGGERNGPPEDCGGVHGYYEKLKIIADKNHEEYKSTIAWLGSGYNPEVVEVDKISKLLKRRDYGCKWIE